jgi:hypothetical protein
VLGLSLSCRRPRALVTITRLFRLSAQKFLNASIGDNLLAVKAFCVACLMIHVAAVPMRGQHSADPVSGMWRGDWGPTPTHRNAVTVELKWDGKILKGIVNPGKNAVRLQKASFDPETGAVHLEAQTSSRMGKTLHYVIDGTVDEGTLIGSWNHDKKKGDFKLLKK